MADKSPVGTGTPEESDVEVPTSNKIDRAVTALVGLLSSFVLTTMFLIIPVPRLLREAGMVPARNRRWRMSATTYLCISTFLSVGFWPLFSFHGPPSWREVQHLVDNFSTDLSVPAILVRSLLLLLPLVFVSWGVPYVCGLRGAALRRVSDSLRYVHGVQLLLVPGVVLVVLAIFGPQRESGGSPAGFPIMPRIYAAGPIILCLHAGLFLHQALWDIRRTSPINWLQACVIILLAPTTAIYTTTACMTYSRTFIRFSEPIRDGPGLSSTEAMATMTADSVEFEITVRWPNYSDEILFAGTNTPVSFGQWGTEFVKWEDLPPLLPFSRYTAEAVSWSGPPGDTLVMNPGEGCWIRYRVTVWPGAIADMDAFRQALCEAASLGSSEQRRDPWLHVSVGGVSGKVTLALDRYGVIVNPP